MGTLFADCAEFPHYLPFPLLMVEAVRAGKLPLLIATLLLSLWEWDHPSLWEERPTRLDRPHTHQEIEEPMPPASHFDVAVQSTSTGPMFSGYDGASDIAIRNHYARRDAQTQIAGMCSMSFAAILNVECTGLDWVPTYASTGR